MLSYSVDVTDEVSPRFKRMIRDNPALSRDILSFVSEAVVNRTVIHQLSGQSLKRKTGTLAKSITYKIMNDYRANVGTNVKYAAIHEFGGVIRPVIASALTFKVKDQWITTKEVKIPARPYLITALDYVMSNEAQGIMDKRLEVWLNKEFYI